MGTSIELTIAKVSLDYAKNHMGNDYGFLFQPHDLARRRYDGISYEYYEEHPDEKYELEESEQGFVRHLSRVLPRLNVLGHTFQKAEAEYNAVIKESISILDEHEERPSYLSFEEFCALACLHPLAGLESEYIEFETKDRDRVAQGRFVDCDEEFSRIPFTDNSDSYWSESSYLSARLCILSAPSMLQVFGLNPANADAEVMWQFGPIVNAGWVEREVIQAGAERTQTVLVVTEGASDARILRRALDLLRPDVSDFFSFIDADERHHFWGAGNLVKFAEGLLRIDIQNQVLFLLDNDAEGVDAYRKLQTLKLSSNMRSMVLPDANEFRNFPARGPDGLRLCDINGRAVAIECYLDLNLEGKPPAQVTWTNYKKGLDIWQGALEFKNCYEENFLRQDIKSLASGNYDISKLIILVDALIAEAARFTR